MPNPYRESAATEPSECVSAARWDDYVLSLMLIVLGTIRVTLAFANHEDFGAEATIAAVMAGLGVLLGIATVAHARR